jgi:hypothetical protein
VKEKAYPSCAEDDALTLIEALDAATYRGKESSAMETVQG